MTAALVPPVLPARPAPAGDPGEWPAAERLTRLIRDATEELARPRGYEEAVALAAGCTVPELADLAVLALHRPDAGLRFEVAHRDPARAGPLRELLFHRSAALERAAAALASHPPVRSFHWIPHLSDRLALRYAEHQPELVELARRLELRSLLLLPLRAEHRALGVLALGRVGPGTRFSALEFAALRVLGNRIAAALQTAWLRGRVAAEHERRAAAESAARKWSQVFEHAPYGTAIVGEGRRLEAVNCAFALMHGFAGPEELVGRPLGALQPERPPERPRESPTDRVAYETRHRRADGSQFPALVTETALRTDGGRVQRAVTVQDLTDLKRAEERFHQAQRAESLGRLAGGIAHEINNMMTVVQGFADLLLLASDLPEHLRDDVEQIQRAADHAAGVVRQLLAFSRRQLLSPCPTHLDRLVAGTLPLLDPLLRPGIRVETRLGLPEGVRVRVDRAQLEQAIVNLALNARDAMPEGGTLTLATSVRHASREPGAGSGFEVPPGPYACLEVADTGVGMDPDTQRQIFDPFFTTKPVGSGTGLGLAQVYGIVKQSGGYIWVDSAAGKGTRFTIWLPVVEAEGRRPLERGRAEAGPEGA